MSTNKTFRDNFLDHVRGLCRFVSFAELRERFPLQFDTALDKLRADSAFEFCELNQPQARALATYSPEAAMYFPAHCYPMVLAYGVAGQSLSASARAAEETKLANLSLSVDARAEALERAQAEAVITVECVRFNFFSFLNEPNAVRRRQLVIPDFMRLMSRRREGFTVADLFLFMGIDVRADAQLLSDLRRRVHYDGREQTFSVSLLEILIDARKMHWDVLSARVGYEGTFLTLQYQLSVFSWRSRPMLRLCWLSELNSQLVMTIENFCSRILAYPSPRVRRVSWSTPLQQGVLSCISSVISYVLVV